MSDSANIARYLSLMAARLPDQAALKVPRPRKRGSAARAEIDYLTLSFAALEVEVDSWAAHLSARGLRTGDRTLVMVRQGLPLIAAAFALFKLGAVPILIDPGIGLKSFLACVARSRPTALVGITLAQVLSRVFRPSFRSVALRFSTSGNPLTRRAPVDGRISCFDTIPRAASDLAAILFTSGSTGAPKGVCYEHGMLEAQVHLIQQTYAIEPGEIDLPMLPIFALFNPALGMTTVVPEIDPSRPSTVDPAAIVQAIQQEKVTNSFGSPTLWNKIADHCVAEGIALPSLRRVLCAGAPVPAALWKKSRQFISQGKLHSPYGATEALPVSSLSVDEVETVQGSGACVGRPVRKIEVKIIAIHDGTLATRAETRDLPPGEIGEIIVQGPVVTKRYDALAEATAAAKIGAFAEISSASADVEIWHRMGDCGYLDTNGRLWFCGRKAERVQTAAGDVFTEPCEQVFRDHPAVARCALIGLGRAGEARPALVVQPKGKLSASARTTLAKELRERARNQPTTTSIVDFFFHPDFPVDVRHNAKIHRNTLAAWAAKTTPVTVV